MIRVLVTGTRGQVGGAVAAALADSAEVIARDHASLDLSDKDAIRAQVRELKPALIVNAAAYTAVDRAEQEPDIARAVNGVAPGILAEEAKRAGAALIHYSTDYVFDGEKDGPYDEYDGVNPLGTYGRTKLEGERAIAASGCAHLILRTSWVYGPTGGNFLLTMLKLAETKPEWGVVDDQVGAPTSSAQLARATRQLVADRSRIDAHGGIYHATASGSVSWYGFARAIFDRWAVLTPKPFRMPRLMAIPASEYPRPARRPANSRLDSAKLANVYGVRLGSWEEGLDEVLRALASR